MSRACSSCGAPIVWAITEAGKRVPLDAAAIPREYLCPDVSKLEAITRATAGDPKIPGWRAFSRAAVRTSRKGGA